MLIKYYTLLRIVYQMRTPYQNILQNQTNVAEFTASSISLKLINEIVETLESNTSVNTISFNHSNLGDIQLKILAEAIIRVGRVRDVLILDNTEITKKSLPVLEELIKSKVIRMLCLFATEDISESPDIIANLQKLAADNKVKISFDSETKHNSLGFFSIPREEKSKDLSEEISKVELEQKHERKNFGIH
jgi:hypothetical protein